MRGGRRHTNEVAQEFRNPRAGEIHDAIVSTASIGGLFLSAWHTIFSWKILAKISSVTRMNLIAKFGLIPTLNSMNQFFLFYNVKKLYKLFVQVINNTTDGYVQLQIGSGIWNLISGITVFIIYYAIAYMFIYIGIKGFTHLIKMCVNSEYNYNNTESNFP